LLWGTLWIPLRQVADGGWNRASATTVGFLLPLVLLAPCAAASWRRILSGGWTLPLLSLCLALSISLYAEGVVRGHVAPVILLFYLTPVWSTLFGWVFLGEPITRRRLLTIVLGLAGLVTILGLGARIPLPRTTAEWMGLAAGVLWGLSMVYVNRTASRPVLDRVLVQFVFLGPVFFLVTLVPGREIHVLVEHPGLPSSMGWLLALALIWMLPVIWLTIFGASHLDPGRVAILLMLEVVIALTTANLLTDEPFGLRELVGAALILGASALEVRPSAPPRISARFRRDAR
jgi:drug/metabolite transporter (DMT)-like permease